MGVAPTPLRQRGALLGTLGLIAGLAVVAAVILILLGHSSFISTAKLEGSGVAAAQARHVAAFHGVELAGSNDVVVHVGGARAVTVRGDANLIRLVTTEVAGGVLVIDQSRGFSTKRPMSVDVTVPSLDSVTLSGSGLVRVDELRGARFTVDLPGSGIVTASGVVTALHATLGGSGQLALQELGARDARVSIAGSGTAHVYATRTLDASVAGSGTIFYGGHHGSVVQRVTGSGAVLAT